MLIYEQWAYTHCSDFVHEVFQLTFAKSFDWNTYWHRSSHIIATNLYSLFFLLHYRMKSTAFLTTIMTLNWIFEIISFYTDASSMLFDIINALQGVFIFVMFVCTPRIFQLIMRWWKDRGSFRVLNSNDDHPYYNYNDIQMTALKNGNNNNRRTWFCATFSIVI